MSRKGVMKEGKSESYYANVRTDVLHLLDPEPGRILDVGGGVGATSSHVKSALRGDFVAVLEGADVTPAPEVDLFLAGDLEGDAIWQSLDEQTGTFDTILCLDVLEHLVDPWAVVRRCSDRLKPGGALIISVPNARYHELTFPLFFLGRLRFRKSGVLDRTHLRWFVKSTAEELATSGGLDLESCEGGWYLDRARAWERLASLGILRGFLYMNYYLKARRKPGRSSVADGNNGA